MTSDLMNVREKSKKGTREDLGNLVNLENPCCFSEETLAAIENAAVEKDISGPFSSAAEMLEHLETD